MAEFFPAPTSPDDGEQEASFFEQPVSDRALWNMIDEVEARDAGDVTEQKFDFSDSLTKLYDELQHAKDLDRQLTRGDRGPELSRRFVIASGNEDDYPFSHHRVKIHPKSDAEALEILDVKSIILRFAMEYDRDEVTGSPQYNNVIVVTSEMQSGETIEYVLTATDWQPVAAVNDLKLGGKEGRVLLGVRNHVAQPEEIARPDFVELLPYFEPMLQSKHR